MLPVFSFRTHEQRLSYTRDYTTPADYDAIATTSPEAAACSNHSVLNRQPQNQPQIRHWMDEKSGSLLYNKHVGDLPLIKWSPR